MRCVKCEKDLDNLVDKGYQPNKGLAFQTYGHYGSTYFDPMNGKYLEIVICDECVEWLDRNDMVYKCTKHD